MMLRSFSLALQPHATHHEAQPLFERKPKDLLIKPSSPTIPSLSLTFIPQTLI